MQSSIPDYTGQFIQHYETIRMIHMQYEYGISKCELSNMMVNRPICRILFAGYLTEQRGTETTEMGGCFPVSLRLVYMQHIQMSVRGSSANHLARATPSVSLAECLLTGENSQECRSFALPAHL